MKYKIEDIFRVKNSLTVLVIKADKEPKGKIAKILGKSYDITNIEQLVKLFCPLSSNKYLKGENVAVAIKGLHNFKQGDEVEIC